LDEEENVSSNQAQTKVAMKTNQPWFFVESLHLNTMAINYWRHFSKYSKD
jgi:lysozyme family protein